LLGGEEPVLVQQNGFDVFFKGVFGGDFGHV
jgi:hypothetical protein